MANIVRRTGDYRDPLSIVRQVFGFDPFLSAWPTDGRAAAQGTFNPTFEVVERDDAFVFTADVPGVREQDLDVTVHDGQLIVSGSRAASDRREGESYYLYERSFGNFTRAFKLPDNADAERVDAGLDSGVLTVSVGKRASAKPRKISLGGQAGRKEIDAKTAKS
jgi:HSP20 family protein